MRAVQLGLSIADLEAIDIDFFMNMIHETRIDEEGYVRQATQEDFDNF